MSAPMRFDPEVRELLGALAGDPDSRLLKLSPAESRRILFERDPMARPFATSTTSAERRLLEAHREEVARLFYGYAELIRRASPPERFWHTGDLVSRPPDPDALGRRARKVLAAPAPFALEDADRRLLESFLQGTRARRAERAAAVSLRLAPTHRARIALALDRLMADPLMADPGTLEARAEMARMAQDERQAVMASYAHDNLGWLAFRSGDLARAARHYEASAHLAETRPIGPMCWLNVGLHRGDRDGVARAMQALDAGVPPDHPAVDWFIEEWRTRERAVWPAPGAGFARLAASSLERAGRTTRRILRALHE